MLNNFRGDISQKEIAKRAEISTSSYDKINRGEKVELNIKVKILKVFIEDEEKIHEIILYFFKQERDKNSQENYIALLEDSQITPFLENAKESAKVSLSEIKYLMNTKLAVSTISDHIREGRPSDELLEVLIPGKYLKKVKEKITQIQNKLKQEETPSHKVDLQKEQRQIE